MTRKSHFVLSLAIALGMPVHARADSLYDMVQKLPSEGVTSTKSIGSLEYCIGLKIGDWLTPITLRGENQVLIYGSPTSDFSNVIYILVRVEDRGTSRAVSFHAHKGWDDKTAALIRSCT